MNTPFINVSGQPTFEKLKIDFPSGVFQTPVVAFLNSFNANFGFNTTPHTFELEYIPADTQEDQASWLRAFQADVLPPIGSGVAFFPAGDFFIKGRIKHADYNKSRGGNVLTIRVEDVRTDLDDFFIDTFGISGSNDSPPVGMIDIRYWFVQTRIKTITGNDAEREAGRSRAFRDLRLLEENGASYRQIYEAVRFFEEQELTITGLLNSIPRPEIVESQLPFNPDAYRWKFKSQPFLQALSRILADVSYDFYWNMAEGRIDVINRRFPVDIDKNNIPVANDPAETISLRFGRDEGERATTFRIFGAEMEGIVGCGDLRVESGAYGFALPSGGPNLEYDLGIQVCEVSTSPEASGTRVLEFEPGWRNATIKYFSPDGSVREFSPSDRQLAAAIKGIEYFTREVSLDNRIDKTTINPTTGVTERQFSFTSQDGKLGELVNRGQPGRSWIIEWYNRVRNFAQNHYSRSYVLKRSAALYDFIDEIETPEEAWSNLENQTDDGSFADNYKVSDRFKFLAPFWNHEANKLKGFCVLENAKWGQDGNGVPGQFNDWNERGTTQYVPIEVRKWNRAEDKFKEEFLAPLKDDEKGIMIRLPNLCWGSNTKHQPDSTLAAVPTLDALRTKFQGDTKFDFADPTELLTPFASITGAAIPIRVKRRYGFKFPSIWASGDGVERVIDVREDLAPWNFEPRGVKQSWELMNDEARSALSAGVADRNFVTFAEATKKDLPIISFDSFANQAEAPQGFGLVTHGVTNLSVTKSISDWWQTKYSLKSHFGQIVRARPVFDGPDEDFAFVIKRLEEDIRRRVPPDIFQPPQAFDPRTNDGREVFGDETLEKFQIPVTIAAVFDRGSDEFYRGVDDRGITWPRALDSVFSLSPDSVAFQNRKASAVDGFLQVGMRAVYNYEELEDGTFVHFFTGGVALGDARVVRLTANSAGDVVRTIRSGTSDVFVANVETLQTTVTSPEGGTQIVTPFQFFNVPFVAQDAVDQSLPANQNIVLTSHGNKDGKGIPPGGNFGPNGANFNDAFLVNSGAPSDIDFGEVTVAPSPTAGTGATVQTVTSTGGTTYVDGNSNGAGGTINVRFVGVSFGSVRVGDDCIIKVIKVSGGDTNVFCYINKVKFAPVSAFGS